MLHKMGKRNLLLSSTCLTLQVNFEQYSFAYLLLGTRLRRYRNANFEILQNPVLKTRYCSGNFMTDAPANFCSASVSRKLPQKLPEGACGFRPATFWGNFKILHSPVLQTRYYLEDLITDAPANFCSASVNGNISPKTAGWSLRLPSSNFLGKF